MPHLIGPDFISIQVADLDAARDFYSNAVGLKPGAFSPPGAVVFDTQPIPFAIRSPLVDLSAVSTLGHGVALWFGSDDADALHDHLAAQGVERRVAGFCPQGRGRGRDGRRMVLHAGAVR
ncbi:VOC family protein [Paenirhodobacter enshiensis]|uniref:VOC family protein n=1 Tax=Paenirhodobacter enshiensis TaxID=1105367 RepID=UPI00126839FF|nr:VOC family protein [Paenirhodobacter enshiensis]